MANWYVDSGIAGNADDPALGFENFCGPDTLTGTAGDDTTGDGSAENPYATLTGLFTNQFGNILPGDTIYLAGRQRPDPALLGDPYLMILDGTGGGVRFTQLEGRSLAVIDAGLMPGGTVTNNATLSATYWKATEVGDGGTNGWKIVCDGTNGKLDLRAATFSGIALCAVTFDWHATGNVISTATAALGKGLRKSHLKAASGADAAAKIAAIAGGTPAAQGLWYLDNTTGTLYVLMPTTSAGVSVTDPSDAVANGIEVVVAGKTAFLFTDSGGSTPHEDAVVDSLIFARWCDASATAPYGNSVAFINTEGCTFRDSVVIDAGDHAGAFGNQVIDATFSNIQVYGGQTGCYFFVFNASGVGNTASGCVGRDLTITVSSLLGHNALTVDRTSNGGAMVGYYVHGPHTAGSIVWDNCNATLYVPASGLPDNYSPFDSDNATAPLEAIHASTFPVYVKDCTLSQGVQWFNQGVTSYIGFERCSFHCEQTYKVTNGHCIDRRSTTGRYHFEACEIVADMRNSNGAANAGIMALGANFTFNLLNTSVYDMAASHSNNKYGMFYFSGAGDVIATGCIFGYRATDRSMRVTIGDGSIDATHHIFSDCMYFNCGYTATSPADVWSENTSFDSAAEWISTIDTGDGYLNVGAVSPFANADGSDLSLTALAKTYKHWIGEHPPQGVNGVTYGGQYGAWQYGGGTGYRGTRSSGRASRPIGGVR